VQLGAQHAAAPGHQVIRAGVADHHAIHAAGSAGAFEVGPGAAESPGVLVHIEQQHQAARQLPADRHEARGYR
jgi:hypothetical protein